LGYDDDMLSIENLACIKGGRPLFKGVSFNVGAGELFHIEGENGAGKTSLLRILSGLSRPEFGCVLWNGLDIVDSREVYLDQVLYLGHHPAIKDSLTVLENLRFSIRLSGVDVEEAVLQQILSEVSLSERLHLPARFLSQGQRRRLVLAKLWIQRNKPLWILDEPFTALDVNAIALLVNRLEEHLTAGGSIILTSHQPPEVADGFVRSIGLGR